MDDHEKKPGRRLALNMLHSPPLCVTDGSCEITRNGSAIPVVLPCVGERYEFAVQRYAVRPSDGSQGEDGFTHLYLTVRDAPDESTREALFWYRAVKAYWKETGLWLGLDSHRFSEEEKKWAAHLRIRGLIGLGLKRRKSELRWGQYGTRDEKRLDREEDVAGYAYIRAEGDGADSSAAAIPTHAFVRFAGTVLTRSSGQADEREFRREYASEMLPSYLGQCRAMQAAAFVPHEKSVDGRPRYVELAKQYGGPFVRRCDNIARSHTGDAEQDLDAFLEAVFRWRETRRKRADEKQRKHLHLFQWDMDYALLNIYSHVAKWLMETTDVKKILDGRSSSYNYFAHTFQKPLLYNVPALHPFWKLCLGSWPRAKVIADAASDIITPEGETLETDESKEAAERLNGVFVAALVVYDKLVTERPTTRGGIPRPNPYFDESKRSGASAAESSEAGVDEDDEEDLLAQERPDEPRHCDRRPAGRNGSFSSAENHILEDEDATPGSRCSQPRNTGDEGWGFDGDVSNIPDPEAKNPREARLDCEVDEFIKGMETEGGRSVLIALDRNYHAMTIEECAAKYGCSKGDVSKRAKKGLAWMKQYLKKQGLTSAKLR